jgi:phage tail sheath gpL-like
MAVLFNFIPGAGLIAPGNFFEVNSGGQFESKSRGLVLGHKSAAGSLADNVLALCSTNEEAAQLAGVGSQLYEAFRVARRHAPVQELWIAAVPVTGNAGAWTLTLSALDAAGGDGVFEIAGRKVAVNAGASEAVNTSAANLAAAINAFVDPVTLAYLPVTATVATNIVTVTARHAGTTLNELELTTDPGLAGNLYAGKIVVAQTVPATGTASVSAALAALGDEPFDWIISPFAETANVEAAEAALSDLSGRWAWNAQLYGHYFTVNTGNTGDNTTFGLARNSRHVSALARVAAPTPSWEMLAAYVARQLPWLADDVSGNAARNMSDLVLEGIRPPRDRTLWPNYVVRNTLLGSGMSTWKVNGVGQVVIDKCVTMQRTNAAGQPDTVFRDVQSIAQVMHGLRYMRAGLSFRHANKAVADANPGNLPAISTPADIKADVIALYGDLVDRGLFENKTEFSRRAQVLRDAGNPARVNIGMDLDRVNPLDILAANATIYAQYPAAA